MIQITFTIILLLLCIFNAKRYNSLSKFLYLVYALMFISSYFYNFYAKQTISFLPSIYLFLILLIWITSFNKVQYRPISYDSEIVDRKLKAFGIIVSILLVPSFFLNLYKFYNNVTIYGFTGEIRDYLFEGLLDNQYHGKLDGVLTTFASFYFIPLFLFIYSFTAKVKWNWFLKLCLFLSSLSFPIFCLVNFGRDGIIYYTFNSIIFVLLLKNQFNKKTLRKLKILMSILIGIILLVLIYITIQRFYLGGESVEYAITGSLGYIGQQLGNFNDCFYFDYQYKGTMFPGYRTYIDQLLGNVSISEADLMKAGGLYDYVNVFRTFVSTILASYGYVGCILFSFLFFLIIRYLNNRYITKNDIFYLLLIIILFQIPLEGVFYYRQGLGRGDISYTIGIIICLICFKTKLYKYITSPSKKI